MNSLIIKQKLQILAEQLKTPHANSGLLRGKMGSALFLYQYARHMDCRYEEYAEKCLDEVIKDIRKVNGSYADGLAGIGTGIEYLVQEGFVDGSTNEILNDVDQLIGHLVSYSHGLIDMRTGIIGYAKYYLARLNNPDNSRKINSNTEFIKAQLSRIVDLLSAYYITYEDMYTVICFLPDVISLDINKKKAVVFFNYAVDLLETTVHEDAFFGKCQGEFNPVIASVLLLRSSAKTGRMDLSAKALCFLEKYESGFRPYLAVEYAVKWSFLYHILWENCNRDRYKKLSAQWLNKITDNRLDLEYSDLITFGMMLLSMNNSISDDWIDRFPLY